mmetsp:Transcript_7693/g.15466  ORF Transcript_7693/g.15466 Transcript_7693/m.15466 type:complete len:310 (+) Transcript_7693:96-1025(+)
MQPPYSTVPNNVTFSVNNDVDDNDDEEVVRPYPPFGISSAEEKNDSGPIKNKCLNCLATGELCSPCLLVCPLLIGLGVFIAGLAQYLQITKYDTHPSKDFVLLDGACNVTNVAHEAFSDFYEYETNSHSGSGRRHLRSLEKVEVEVCIDRYTLNFTAPDDSFSTIHSSVTRELERCFSCSCDDTAALPYSDVLGIESNGKCWKPTPRLSGKTEKYLKQCGERPIDLDGVYKGIDCHEDMKKNGIVYECADLACYKIVDPNEFYGRWVGYCRRMMIGGGVVAAFFMLLFGFRWIVRKIAGLEDDSCHWDQ